MFQKQQQQQQHRLHSRTSVRIPFVCLVLLQLLLLLGTAEATDCGTWVPPEIPSDGNVYPGFIFSPSIIFRSPGEASVTWGKLDVPVDCPGMTLTYRVFEYSILESQFDFDGSYLCSVVDSDTCDLDSNLLNDGETYLWTVIAYPDINDLSRHSRGYELGLFKWCVTEAPVEPILLEPTNATFDYNAPLTFKWEGLTNQDFGKSCSSVALPVINMYIGNDTNTLFDENYSIKKRLTTNSAQYLFDTSTYGILPAGTWYWALEADSGIPTLVTPSTIFSFTVLEEVIIPCDPPCATGKGNCDTSVGKCVCFEGFEGDTCATSSVVSTTPAPLDGKNLGLLIGAPLGALFFLVLIAVVILILYYRREKKKNDVYELSMIRVEPPDFAVLAFAGFNIDPNPFIENSKQRGGWKFFEQLILSQDYHLAISVLFSAKVSELDHLCAWLVLLFESHGAGSALIRTLLLREIQDFDLSRALNQGEDANPMPFRGDSFATKCFKTYARIIGLPYLFETLGQVINDFCALMDDEVRQSGTGTGSTDQLTANSDKSTIRSHTSIEVDPSRMTSMEDETINRLSLQLVCQKIFVKIYRSLKTFPIELRTIFKTVVQDVKERNNLKDINMNVLLSNLVFLRFINPAILMPKNFGLMKEEPPTHTKRQLILITKVMQNLAAGVEFGKKEAYMAKLNDFIRSNSSQMNEFLTKLPTEPTPEERASAGTVASFTAPISDTQFNAALAGIYSFCYSHRNSLFKMIEQEGSPARSASIKESLDKAFSEIGQPTNY